MVDFNLRNQSPSFLKFIKRVLQAHWVTLLLFLVGIGLPLLAFQSLAVVVLQEQGGFAWDNAILLAIHTIAMPLLDQIAKTVTKTGGFHGITLLTTFVGLILLVRKRWRSLLYLVLTLSGSGMLNRVAKTALHRVRPHLWEQLEPKLGFAFPSGHAMGSMTLVMALIILTWGTRWSWSVILGGSAFVMTIAWTRLYLGVHFPSDILAGWLAAIAWSIGVNLIIRPHMSRTNAVDEVEATPEELSHSN
ncbi:phosphatase PAP2 family protein [Cyanobacteria bacterium FACHB-63]|nr:phosphatase PAP2 family protein [Cyanobacteria bacterium FACHB-63]